jgi:hypothetical protein
MSKIDELRKRLERCRAQAAAADDRELRRIWNEFEKSFAFLVEWEQRGRGLLDLPIPLSYS